MKLSQDTALDINTITFAGDDAVVPFSIESLDARGRALQMGAAFDAIVTRHDYPSPVARLLGEMIVLTALLGTAMKFDGQLIMQAQTDGPVSLLVVDFKAPGDIRAHARFDDAALALAIEKDEITPEQLLGKGVLAMTIDQGDFMNRYQGMVALEGDSLEEVAHAYFIQSEQIPTRVRLSVAELVSNEDGETRRSWRAGGALVQFLPESEDRIKQRDLHGGDGDEGQTQVEDDNAWIEAQSLFATIKDDELIDPDISSERLLFRLFHEQSLRLYPPQMIFDKCSCSSEKIWSVLRAMSKAELDEAAENGKIQVKCEFCGTDYSVTPDELSSLKS